MSSSNRTVHYRPLTEETFGAASRPAQSSKEPDDQLYAKGFARLGSLAVTHVLERCSSAESRTEKCEKIQQPIGPTADLLQEAAGRGGEIVTLLEDAKSEQKATAGTRCMKTTTVRDYSSMVYYKGQFTPGTVARTECAEWEKTLSRELHSVSFGIIWKLDPVLAKSQQGAEKLALAASDGDLASVRTSVEHGIPADTRDPNGIPIVGWAAGAGHQDVVEYLITQGARLDSSVFLMSPLQMAVAAQDLKMISYLISKGAKVDGRDKSGNTALLAACLRQQTSVVKSLMDAGADVNVKNEKGITPLMAAVLGMKKENRQEDHNILGQEPEIARMIMEKGVNEKAADKTGKRVLDYAAETAEYGKSAAFYLNWQVGAFGYIDKQGKWVIKPAFQEARGFSDGLAAVVDWYYVSDIQKTGFIDRAGKLVIKPRFRYAGDFHQGLAWASMDAKTYGFIDKTGKYVIEPVYGGAGNFSEGLASVSKGGKIGYINKKGGVVIAFQYDEAHTFENGIAFIGNKDSSGKMKYGYINKSGNWIIPPQYDMLGLAREGLVSFKQIVDEKPLWGFLDFSGKIAIPAKFNDVRAFSEGLAAFREQNGKKFLWGYIDRTGNVVIAPRFDMAYLFSGGFAKVREEGFLGSSLKLINRKGEIFSDVEYDDVGLISDGLYMAVTKKGISGKPAVTYIDPTGKTVVNLDAVGQSDAEWTRVGATIFLLTIRVTPKVYAESFSEGLAPVRVQGDAFLKAWK